MATHQQQGPHLFTPHTLQAQLAAHYVTERADQIVAQAAKLSGEPQSGVLLHRCFSQIEHQPKPDHCACERILYGDALELINSGKADWFIASRAGKPYRSQRIIVWRATAQEIRDYEIHRREGEPRRLAELEVVQRAEELKSIERESIKRLRQILFDAVQSARLQRIYAGLTDTEHRWMLRDPERWREQLGPNVFRLLLAIASGYWERILTHFGLHEDLGKYMSCGGKLLHTGDYQLDQIDARQNANWGDGPAGEPRALAQPCRPAGADPHSEMLDDEWKRAVAMANHADRIQQAADSVRPLTSTDGDAGDGHN